MSSTERAPEPTMDEILASIRRIISDDEASPSPDPRPPASHHTRPAPARSDDRPGARDAIPGSAQASEEDDDILDLTKVLAEGSYGRDLTPQAPEPALGAGRTEFGPAELERAMAEVAEALDHAELSEDEQAPTPDEHGPAEDDVLLADAEFEIDDVVRESTPEAAAPPASAGPSMPLAASPETPAGLSQPSQPVDPRMLSWDDEPISFSDSLEREVADAWPSERTALPEAEASAEPPVAPVRAIIDDLASRMSMPSSPATAAATPNGLAAERGGGEAARTTGAKSFEDSIKDMLRPMLREWLDENLPRLLEDTVREELGSRNPAPRPH